MPNSKEHLSTKQKIRKRFNIIFIIFCIAALISTGITFFSGSKSVVIANTTLYLSIGLGIWFFVENKMLRYSEFYLKSLIVAISFIAFWYIILLFFQAEMYKDTIKMISFYPISLLLVQFPLRKIYKKIIGKEPNFKKIIQVENTIYILILAILPFLLPLISPYLMLVVFLVFIPFYFD